MAIANIFCAFQEIHFNVWTPIYPNVLALLEISEWWVFKVVIKSKTEPNKYEEKNVYQSELDFFQINNGENKSSCKSIKPFFNP